MTDASNVFTTKLSDLDRDEWFAAMGKLGRKYGMYEKLGDKHAALLVDEGETLVVTFETVEDIRDENPGSEPLGFDLIRATGWSLLSVMSDGDTWFRDPKIYEFFDALTDDGFFDGFDRIVFYGRGACGYAAAAFSAAAPGSAVVALSPQATLDPERARWDQRFRTYRRLNFTDRYGYAPDMLEAANDAYILFDSKREEDAAHAALFKRDHVHLTRLPHASADLQIDLLEAKVLYRLLARVGVEPLSSSGLGRMIRARRIQVPYLRRVLLAVEETGNRQRTAKLARAILQHVRMPIARKRLSRLLEDGIELPDPLKAEA